MYRSLYDSYFGETWKGKNCMSGITVNGEDKIIYRCKKWQDCSVDCSHGDPHKFEDSCTAHCEIYIIEEDFLSEKEMLV